MMGAIQMIVAIRQNRIEYMKSTSKNCILNFTRNRTSEIENGIILCMVVFCFVGCNKDPELRAAELVCATIYPNGEKKLVEVEFGELDGGYVVITGQDEVFWVFDKKVYSVNDKAQKAAPTIPLVKSTITEKTAKAAAHSLVKRETNNEPKNVPIDMKFLRTNFEKQRSVIESEGVPSTITELTKWYPEPPHNSNAAEIYIKACHSWLSKRKLQLLYDASAMEFYRYPTNWDTLSNEDEKYDLPDVELLSGMRHLSVFLAATARSYAEKRECDSVMKCIDASINLSRHMSKSPLVIIQLNRFVCLDTTTQSLDCILSLCDFNDEQLLQLDHLLINASCENALLRAWFAENIIFGRESPINASGDKYYVSEAKSLYRLNRVRVRIATIRYSNLHNNSPSRIEDLIPTFLDTIPINPLSGTPMTLCIDEKTSGK